MKNEESLIQVEIVKYLQSKDIYFWATPNESAGSNKIRAMQMISLGMRSGISDLIAILPTPDLPYRIVFIEVKTQTGRQSDNQKKFEARVTDAGYEFFLVRSVDDVKSIVENHVEKYWGLR